MLIRGADAANSAREEHKPETLIGFYLKYAEGAWLSPLFLHDFFDVLFLKNDDAGKFFAFHPFQKSAARSGQIRQFIRNAGFFQRGNRIAAAAD